MKLLPFPPPLQRLVIFYYYYYSHSERDKVLSYYGFDFTPHLLFTFNWIVLLSLWELVMLHQPHHFSWTLAFTTIVYHVMSVKQNIPCHCPHFLPLYSLAWLHFCLSESFCFIQTHSSVSMGGLFSLMSQELWMHLRYPIPPLSKQNSPRKWWWFLLRGYLGHIPAPPHTGQEKSSLHIVPSWWHHCLGLFLLWTAPCFVVPWAWLTPQNETFIATVLSCWPCLPAVCFGGRILKWHVPHDCLCRACGPTPAAHGRTFIFPHLWDGEMRKI